MVLKSCLKLLAEKLKTSLDVDRTGIGLYLLTNLGIGSF